jgi:hypothetical protein
MTTLKAIAGERFIEGEPCRQHCVGIFRTRDGKIGGAVYLGLLTLTYEARLAAWRMGCEMAPGADWHGYFLLGAVTIDGIEYREPYAIDIQATDAKGNPLPLGHPPT